MPRTPLLLLTLASTLAGCHRGAPPPTSPIVIEVASTEARPQRRRILSLVDHGSMGSAYDHTEVPAFVMYEDGLVIYVDGEGETARPMQVRLEPDAVYRLLDAAHAKVGELPESNLLVHASDQPEAGIFMVHHGRHQSVRMYGLGRDGASSLASTPPPAEFVALYRELLAFAHPDAEPWQPDEIEVVLYRKDDLRDDARPWPSTIPLPPSDAREPRPLVAGVRSKAEYQQPLVYLVDGELEPAIEKSLAGLGELTPIAWNGTAWYVRTRRVVPG